MLRFFLISLFLLQFSCVTKHLSSTHIAIIRGESLNFRTESDEPAPYESKVAFECLEMETKPVIKFYSRNRSLELFKAGQVDVVVSGQASIFPKELLSYRRVKAGTKAIILYKKTFDKLGEVSEIPNRSKVGVLENSAFATSFVIRAGDIELKVYREISEAIASLKQDKIDCLVIDQIASEHIAPLVPGAKTRILDLAPNAVSWLYR